MAYIVKDVKKTGHAVMFRFSDVAREKLLLKHELLIIECFAYPVKIGAGQCGEEEVKVPL